VRERRKPLVGLLYYLHHDIYVVSPLTAIFVVGLLFVL